MTDETSNPRTQNPELGTRPASLAPYLWFLLLALAFFWPVLLGRCLVPAEYLRWMGFEGGPDGSLVIGHRSSPHWNPLMADGILQFYPWRAFARECLRKGEVPLWNPRQFCGTPFAANGQSAVFYPPNVIFWLIPTPYAFGISALLHFFLAGCFMFWFAGAMGMGRWGAALAGTAFMLNGFAVTWLALPTLPYTLIWVPLAGFAAKKHFDSNGGFAWPLLMGLAVCFMLLAGHLQVAYYGLLFLVAYLIFLKIVVWRARGGRILWRLEVQEKTGLALGLLAASAQILPTLELSRYNHRLPDITPAAFDWLQQWALTARHFVLLFIPDFYGNPSAGTYLDWPNNYAELCGYVGAATMVLAIVPLVRRRSAHTWFFAGAGAFALLVASGSPVARWMFFYLPGFGRFSGLARILCLFELAVAVLAGFGLQALVGKELAAPETSILRKAGGASSSPTVEDFRRARCPRWLLLVPGIALSAAVVFATLSSIGRRAPTLWEFEQFHVIAWATFLVATLALVCLRDSRVMAGGLIGLVALDLFSFGVGYNSYSRPSEVFPETDLVRALREDQRSHGGRMLALTSRWGFGRPPVAALPPNIPMVYGLDDIQGYDSLFPRWVKEFMFEANHRRQPSPLINGNMILLGRAVERGAWSVERDSSSPAAARKWPSLDYLTLSAVRRIISPVPPPVDWGFVERARFGELRLHVREAKGNGQRAMGNGQWATGSTVGAGPRARPSTSSEGPNGRGPAERGEGIHPARVTREPTPDYRRLGANTVRLSLPEGAEDALVPVTYYPGWRVFRGQEEGAVERAEIMFCGVRVDGRPGGEAILTFLPGSVAVGLFLSLLSVGVAAGLCAGRWPRSWPSPAQEERMTDAGRKE